MIPRLPLLTLAAALALGLALFAERPVQAQNPFRVVAEVGDRVVTAWEVEQRARLLTALNTPGDLPREALETLIEERVRAEAARRSGVSLTEDELRAGVARLAATFDLSPEELVEVLAEDGIAPETFRDYVSAQLLWNKTIGARFGGRVEITERELDTAIARARTEGRVAFLLSEIIVPYAPEAEAAARAGVEQLRAAIRTGEDFEQAARLNSRAATAEAGGRVEGWLPADGLPSGVRRTLMQTPVGGVSPVIDLPGALLLFYKRGVRAEGVFAGGPTTLRYARLRLPGPRSEEAMARAEGIRARLDGCNDLLAAAQTTGPGGFAEETVGLRAVPGLYATALAQLDPGESTISVVEGDFVTILMLCSRSREMDEAQRAELRDQLTFLQVETYGRTLANQVRSTLEIRRR